MFTLMYRIFLCLCIALLSGLLYAQEEESLEAKLREPVPPMTDPGSRKIIEAHLSALGGQGRIMMIHNTVSKGTLREAKDEYDVVYYRAAPNKLRTETSERKMGRTFTDIEGTNGTVAWTFDNRSKNAFPKEMGRKEADEFILQADFYGPFVNWEQKDNVFAYEGEVKSRGRKHFLVKMYRPNGRATYFYFDAKTMMVTRVGRERIMGKSIVEMDTHYTKYERVNGVWYPSRIEFAIADQVFGSLVLDSIEANQPLDPDLFEMPKVREVWLRKK